MLKIINFFGRFSVSKRIISLVVTSLLGLAIITISFLWLEQQLRSKIEENNHARNIIQESMTVQGMAHSLQGLQELYTSTRDNVHHVNFIGKKVKLEEQLLTLEQLVQSTSATSFAQNISIKFTHYFDSYGRLSKNLETLSMNEKNGLKERISNSVHTVEGLIKKYSQNALMIKMLMMRRHEKDFMLRGDTKYIGRLNERYNEFKTILKKSTLSNSIQTDILNQLTIFNTNMNNYAASITEINVDRKELNNISVSLNKELSDFVLSVIAQSKAAQINQKKGIEDFRFIILLTEAIIAVCLIGLATPIVLSLTQPIRDISFAMMDLATGKQNVNISIPKQKHEIGLMIQSLEKFQINLQENVALKIQTEEQAKTAENERANHQEEINKENSKKATQIKEQADTIKSTFNQMVKEIEDELNLSLVRVDKQSKNTTKIASEITESATNVGNDAKTVSTKTHDILGFSNAVSTAADNLTSSIQEINKHTENSNTLTEDAEDKTKETKETVHSLEMAAKDIEKIIHLISDIAEQTNLLALNATIESARAGEAGKGFAVVAGEVKNLASQTTKSIEEITRHVGGIQSIVSNAVKNIDQIDDSISKLKDNAKSIASEVTHQSSITQEIVKNINTTNDYVNICVSDIDSISLNAHQTSSVANGIDQISTFLTTEVNDIRSNLLGIITKSIDANKENTQKVG